MWKSRYPGSFLTVNHADMVQDPQAEIGRILAFAGLTSQPACYSPHETRRPIATFSSVQVRQPVSTAFSGRARNYESCLVPLREALLKAGINLKADTAANPAVECGSAASHSATNQTE
jgi:hypothetical protein